MIWTKEEIEFLKKNYPSNPDMDFICKKLNRSRRAIQHKGERIGISRQRFFQNKSCEKQDRKTIEKRYYEKNKKDIYNRKMERIKNFRRELKNNLGGKCHVCGYCKCLDALEFHHKTGEKENHVSRLIKDFSKQKSLKEVKKCILLCANCHRELHNKGL